MEHCRHIDDLQLSALSRNGRSPIIDLAQVSFLSSMGIRSIVRHAKAVALRQAKLGGCRLIRTS